MNALDQARDLLKAFKGDAYLYGNGVLKDVGKVAAKAGKKPALIYTDFPGVDAYVKGIRASLKQAGYIREDLSNLHGRDLGVAVANGMFAFAKAIDFPTTLGEVEGFTQDHIRRALTAAKNPQLKMKLENMPIPMTAEMIDAYMGPILEAGKTGDLSLIKNVK